MKHQNFFTKIQASNNIGEFICFRKHHKIYAECDIVIEDELENNVRINTDLCLSAIFLGSAIV